MHLVFSRSRSVYQMKSTSTGPIVGSAFSHALRRAARFGARKVILAPALLIAILTGGPGLARARTVDSLLSQGKPALESQVMGEAGYVASNAQRLKNARIVWVNYDLLRELGIEVPPEGMTPEFEKQLLDAFAYINRGAPEPPDKPWARIVFRIARRLGFYDSGPEVPDSEFLPRFRTFFADRYGGSLQSIGLNYGSGRAQSAGEVQIKGSGRTALVNPLMPGRNHADGVMDLVDGLQDAVFGEVMNRELP